MCRRWKFFDNYYADHSTTLCFINKNSVGLWLELDKLNLQNLRTSIKIATSKPLSELRTLPAKCPSRRSVYCYKPYSSFIDGHNLLKLRTYIVWPCLRGSKPLPSSHNISAQRNNSLSTWLRLLNPLPFLSLRTRTTNPMDAKRTSRLWANGNLFLCIASFHTIIY